MPTPIPVDANTIALWRFDEATKPYLDEVGGYELTQTDQSSFIDGLVGQAIQLPAGTGNEDFALLLTGGSALDADLDAMGDGFFTIEMLVNIQTNPATGAPFISIANPTDDRCCDLGVTVGDELQALFEGFVPSAYGSVAEDGWHYIAIVRGFVSAGMSGQSSNERFQIYVDGVLQVAEVSDPPAAVTGALLAVGAQLLGGVVDPGDPSLIYLQDLRISNIARTPEEVMQVALDYGFTPVNPPTPTIPDIVLVSPDEGQIARFDTVVVDVTDDDGLGFIVFSANFGGIQIDEVIYRTGKGFTARYTGENNTIANITGGYRFTMRRAGGWPSGSIAFDADAVSSTGGVA